MAFFTFTDSSQEIFVFRLDEAADIAHARALIAGTETADPLIAGVVEKHPADYNIGWSFHLDPASLFFFEVSTEVGDSTMRFIEDHLDEVGGELLPGSVWTGWSTVILDELALVNGGTGGDRLGGSAKADIVFGRTGDDELTGRAGDDHLVGGRGGDRASGGQGADKLAGEAGDDTLIGGDGRDTLVGGAGDDLLKGQAGGDTFLFDDRFGSDAVRGFQPGLDAVDLRPLAGIDHISDLVRETDSDGNAVLLAGGSRITFLGLGWDHLAVDDFLLN